MASNDFLTALASVCSALRDLQSSESPASRLLAAAVEAELASTSKRNVRDALLAGDVLRAANSTYAGETFRSDVGRILAPVVAPLTEVLAVEFADVLDREDAAGFLVRVDPARASHLPRGRRRDGVLSGSDVREVLSAAIGDPVIVALWASAQAGVAAAPTGFARYAANNSAFVNRQRLFGARVSLSGTPEGTGRYVYDFEEALTRPLEEADGDFGRVRESDLEYSLLLDLRRTVGTLRVPVFGALLDGLYRAAPAEIDLLLRDANRDELFDVAGRAAVARAAGTDESVVRATERAAIRVLRAMHARAGRAARAA